MTAASAHEITGHRWDGTRHVIQCSCGTRSSSVTTANAARSAWSRHVKRADAAT